jgi:hypothetical protein
MTVYRPMTLADLAARLSATPAYPIRWKLVWEFMEEYRWEPPAAQSALLLDEPPTTGDERWDALLAALADHLSGQRDAEPPSWTASRVLDEPWFPAELEAQRVDARETAPPAFRRHGVWLSAIDLESA